MKSIFRGGVTFKIGIISLAMLFLLCSLVAALNCPTGVVPNIGHVFEGYANYGSSVLASQTVTATLDGNDFSTTTNSNGFYTMSVDRCSNSAATSITFTVCTRAATETAAFGEAGVSNNFNLTISSACPTTTTSTSGGGGGGGSSAGGTGGGGAAVVSKINLDGKSEFASESGYTAKQTQGDTATFTAGGNSYTAELTKLGGDSVTVTVAGQSVVLKIGGSSTFDVNGDGVADIFVQLMAISGGRAEVVYKALVETGMMALLDTVRAFYEGKSTLTMMGLLDRIRAFYGS